MKYKVRIVLLTLLLSFYLMENTSGISSGSNQVLVSKFAYKQGSFILSNTSEAVNMMTYGAQELNIGTIYNFTINMNASSTSGINVSLLSFQLWRGSPHVFQVSPNENMTVTYTQHSTSDALDLLNLRYHLLNSSGTASGTYEVIRVSTGYPINVGTGGVYIDNITQWLIDRSKTTASTPLNITFSIPFLFLTIAVACSYRKKRTE